MPSPGQTVWRSVLTNLPLTSLCIPGRVRMAWGSRVSHPPLPPRCICPFVPSSWGVWDSPLSSNLPPCHHLALSPVRTTLGMSSMRWRPYLALIPTVRRETTPSFTRSRPTSFTVHKIVSILASPSSTLFFSLSTCIHLWGILTPTI